MFAELFGELTTLHLLGNTCARTHARTHALTQARTLVTG